MTDEQRIAEAWSSGAGRPHEVSIARDAKTVIVRVWFEGALYDSMKLRPLPGDSLADVVERAIASAPTYAHQSEH